MAEMESDTEREKFWKPAAAKKWKNYELRKKNYAKREYFSFGYWKNIIWFVIIIASRAAKKLFKTLSIEWHLNAVSGKS